MGAPGSETCGFSMLSRSCQWSPRLSSCSIDLRQSSAARAVRLLSTMPSAWGHDTDAGSTAGGFERAVDDRIGAAQAASGEAAHKA
jgi:hypothetical protein